MLPKRVLARALGLDAKSVRVDSVEKNPEHLSDRERTQLDYIAATHPRFPGRLQLA